MFIEQYKNKDILKENLEFKPRIVYDSTELTSPFYSSLGTAEAPAQEYIRKEDLIPSGPVKPGTFGGTTINNYSM